METSLNEDELKNYLRAQLNHFFPDRFQMKGKDVDISFSRSLERLENCFSHLLPSAYCTDDGQTHFSHLHADQYAQFLYFFSNTLWNVSQNKNICDKVMYLNRILNNFMFSYKGSLPDIFFFGHPVGSVLGNAAYNDYLVVFQNVTINTGSDTEGAPAPILGKGLFLGAGAKIIGNKRIGDRVSVSVNTVVYNQEIEDDKVVITDRKGNTVVKDRKKDLCHAQMFFRDRI